RNTTPFVMIKKRKEDGHAGGPVAGPSSPSAATGKGHHTRIGGGAGGVQPDRFAGFERPQRPGNPRGGGPGKKRGMAPARRIPKNLAHPDGGRDRLPVPPFPGIPFAGFGNRPALSDRPAKTVPPPPLPRGTPRPQTVRPHPHRSGTLEGKNRKTRMDDSRAAGGLGGEKTEARL